MEDQVRRIRLSVEALLEERTTLQETIALLQQQNAELTKRLELQETAIQDIKSKSASESSTTVQNEVELKKLREQIQSYIKEIDQCIASLKNA